MSLAFVALRLLDGYGDPSRWSGHATPVRTVLSLLNTTKYPPSLLFLLMTLGPALAAMPLLDRARSSLAGAVGTIGRVPPSSGCCTCR